MSSLSYLNDDCFAVDFAGSQTKCYRAQPSSLIVCLALLLGLLLPHSVFAEATTSKLSTLGYVEDVMLLPEQIHLQAKLDTGAGMSSLHAANIQYTTRADETWLRFTTTDSQRSTPVVLERRLQRYAKILKRSDETSDENASHSRRPVVEVDICLAGIRTTISVNLIDRAEFAYPMLLGRSDLKKIGVIVDPAKKQLQEADCQQSGGK